MKLESAGFLFKGFHKNVSLHRSSTSRFMIQRLKFFILLTSLITATSSKSCTVEVSYILCNGVTIHVLRSGQYPMTTTTVSAIHFNNNNLTIIEEDVLRPIYNLRYVVIINNLIRTLHSNLFLNLNEIIHIDLSSNKIRYLGENLFKSQSNLQYLLLRYNQITTLDSSLFIPLTSLHSLDLADNPFLCNCHLQNVVRWCQIRNLTGRATCKDGTPWESLTFPTTCKLLPTISTNEIFTYPNYVYSTDSVAKELLFTTEKSFSDQNNEERSFSKEQVLTIIGVVAVLILCAVVGIFLCIRSKNLTFMDRNKALYIGRIETEDCHDEFVSARRLDSYLDGSLSQVPLYAEPSPECREFRRPSETDSDGSVFLYTPQMSPVEKTIPELPDLAAYAEPFHRGNSPVPVYAVPVQESGSHNSKIKQDENTYSIPYVVSRRERHDKSKK